MLLWLLGALIPSTQAADPLNSLTNLALGKPVTSSAATWPGLNISGITDGSADTFTHPAADSGTLNYHFQVDLGRVYSLDRILIRNRNDGCCPERLTRYAVELYRDSGGQPGTLAWSALVRTNDSNSGVGGIDTLVATNHPAGVFSGRFVRVVNRSGGAYNPQVAEIEVYGALPPAIRSFEADQDVLNAGQSTRISWTLERAQAAWISPEPGPVDPVSGSLTVTPASTIEYTLSASNQSGVVTAKLPIGVGVVLAPPRITEFLTLNGGGLKDEDGDSPDWIELSNPNPYALRMDGYALTDNPNQRTQWLFPSVKIPRNGTLIVFASGKDRRIAGAPLHSNFKLDAAGEFLALTGNQGVDVVQIFPVGYPTPRKYPAQHENVSYGIDPNGRAGFFTPPTPGAANGTAYEGVVENVVFSRERGFLTNEVTLELSCATPGVTIRYTTNNLPPGPTTGQIYQQPIPLTQTTLVRASAFREGWAPAPVITHTYLVASNVIRSPVLSSSITKNTNYAPQLPAALLDLPSISIVTPGTVNDTTEVPSSFEWIGRDGLVSTQANCGIQYYGGAFTAFDKKSFRIYFRSEYGASKLRHPLFEGFANGVAPVETFDQLELRSGSHDMAMRGFYMSNTHTDDTLLEMGRLNPHGRYVHLYLNGVYWGVYHLRERWCAAMHSEYLGGDAGEYEAINGNWNVGGWADPGTPYDGDGSAWERVKSLRGSYEKIRDYLDVPEYIDYMLMWLYGGSEDEYRCVGPTGPGSGFKFYLNDADGWFCISAYCAAGDKTARGTPGRQGGDGPGSIFSMLLAEGHPDYRVLLADRIQAALFNNGALTAQRSIARLDRRCAEMERPFLLESARWGYLTPAEWALRRNEARNDWLVRRTGEVLTQWRAAGLYPKLDAPVMIPSGGITPPGTPLSFAAPTNAVIHFTLDGSDPRLPGGAVSPSALSNVLSATTQVLVSTGSVWRWFSSPAGLGRSDIVAGRTNWSSANWKHPEFDDSTWKQDPARFGFGEGDEATVIPSLEGTNRIITTYFRRRFTVEQPESVLSLPLRVRRDDGVIVYLNGVSIARSSLASGNVTGTTTGITAVDDGKVFTTITALAAPGALRAGENTLAVELHQNAALDDATFDLELLAIRAVTTFTQGTTLDRNTVVKARARQTNQWSALNTLFFQANPSPLPAGSVAFSEIHYNPAGADDTEFIELQNVSHEAVNLRGARLSTGVRFEFSDQQDTLLAPGERVLIAGDMPRFQSRYGNRIPLAGRFFGNLNNAGDRLTLVDAGGSVVASIEYGTTAPWPAGVDGDGFSLVLSHPWMDAQSPAAWRRSVAVGGSPGGSDTSVPPANPAEDLDGDGFSAQVEYALGTSDTDPESGPGSTRFTLEPDGSFSITFPRNLGADSILLRVDASDDLITWVPASLLSTEAIAGDPLRVAERWGVTANASHVRFLRLRVSAAP